jgi:hypothetical protein
MLAEYQIRTMLDDRLDAERPIGLVVGITGE